MPMLSKKQAALKRIDQLTERLLKRGVLHKLFGLPIDEIDSLLVRCRKVHQIIRNERHLRRGPHKKKTEKFSVCLSTDHGDSLSDKDFKFHFRLNRPIYWQLVGLLQDHPAFHHKSSGSRGLIPKPATHQLLIALKHLGTDGNQASSIALGNFFGVGAGVIDYCGDNGVQAILSLEDKTCFWPDESERSSIAARIKEQHKLPNCIGLIDGTLLPLAERPLLHGENYLSRKKFYAMVMLVVCDDLGRVLYYHIGWPGSVHDNRVWRTCKLFTRYKEFFSAKQYLLGDSAFTASDIMVPPFKNLHGQAMDATKSTFHTLLAKPRVNLNTVLECLRDDGHSLEEFVS